MLCVGDEVAAEGEGDEVAFHTEATRVTESLLAVDHGEDERLAVLSGVLQGVRAKGKKGKSEGL